MSISFRTCVDVEASQLFNKHFEWATRRHYNCMHWLPEMTPCEWLRKKVTKILICWNIKQTRLFSTMSNPIGKTRWFWRIFNCSYIHEKKFQKHVKTMNGPKSIRNWNNLTKQSGFIVANVIGWQIFAASPYYMPGFALAAGPSGNQQTCNLQSEWACRIWKICRIEIIEDFQEWRIFSSRFALQYKSKELRIDFR